MKRTLITVFIICSTASLFSQNAKFGVYVDPQLVWLSPDSREVVSDGVKMGISGGLMIDSYFQKNYAIHTGIAIGTQGGKVRFGIPTYFTSYDETDSLPSGTTVDYSLNYITIPLGLKLKTNQIGYFSYYARIGFTNQFNIKAKATSSEGTLDKNNINEEIFFYNLAYHFGIGIEYNISQDTAIDFGITYHNGFIDLTNDKAFKIYSRMVALRLGVIF
jgi:opacity protein-like surface antigen